MQTHLNSWGNSHAVRIPKALMELVGLNKDSPIDISVRDGGIFIKPLTTDDKPRFTLEELLAQIPEGYDRRADEDVREWLDAPPVGKEIIDDDWS